MIANQSYHLYTHANGSENLFRNDENYGYFLERYKHFILPVADTLAYCLMPNHLHFLVRVKTEAELEAYFINKKYQYLTGLEGDRKQDLSGINPGIDLSKLVVLQFSHLFNAYTKAYNKMYQRRGSLFTRSFRRKEITNDTYFTQLIYYIHANPVHHGFIKNISDWRWSSYEDVWHPEATFIKHTELLTWFGGSEAYKKIHTEIKPKLSTDFDMDV